MGLNIQNTNLKMTAGLASQFPKDAIPQVALSGRSNVGKSSLINTLLGRKSLARVSATPGKTITVNFYEVDKKMFLVDLPGYGFAARSHDNKGQWSSLTDGYFTKNKNKRNKSNK
jgi:GTP-binding protein